MFDIFRIRRAYNNQKLLVSRLKRFGNTYKRHADNLLSRDLTILTIDEVNEIKRLSTMAKDAFVAAEKQNRTHRYIIAWFQEWGFFLPKDENDGIEES